MTQWLLLFSLRMHIMMSTNIQNKLKNIHPNVMKRIGHTEKSQKMNIEIQMKRSI